MKRVVVLLGVLGCGQAVPAETTSAEVLEVRPPPASLQDEVDRDPTRVLIQLQNRRYCGATIARRVVIEGRGATIVACPNNPAPIAGLADLQAGIFLQPGADGSVFEDLRFEGRGVAQDTTRALTFAIFSRNVDNVRVLENRVAGTVQAITDAGGRGWLIESNHVRDLEVFGCDGGGLCSGGDAIVVEHVRTGDASADDVSVRQNRLSVLAPPADLIFSVTGIIAVSVERPFIADNDIVMDGSPSIGIEFTRTTGGGLVDAPCGNGTILENRVRGADTDVDVSADCAAGTVDLGNRSRARVIASAPRPLL
jgi:hypothetical protein